MSSARFDKQNEEYQVLVEIELNTYLKTNRNLKVSDVDDKIVRSEIEEQIQKQESRESG